MRVLIAPDKFKGSLSAPEAAAAIERGIRRAWPDARTTIAPIADGGEGTAEALLLALGGEWRIAPAHDAMGVPVEGRFAWFPARRMAVIEMSEASGMWRIASDRRNPLKASTFGTGELISSALALGATEVIVGLGGSATNDGGAGMAAALGWQFLTSDGDRPDPLPENFPAITRVKLPKDDALSRAAIVVACDVRNPLLGPQGASRVYGPQKGATPPMVEQLEQALEHLADVVAADIGTDLRNAPGAGAAGGLGYGMMTFCNATFRTGFDLVAETVRLREKIADSDLVITGEGSLDAQTLHGKGPSGVAILARELGVPVVAFAGRVEEDGAFGGLFAGTHCITPPGTPLDEALRKAPAFLEVAVESFAREWPRQS